MKKIFATMMAFAVIASMTVLSSCGGAPSNEQIAKIVEKYDDGGGSSELSDKDYDMLLDYLDAAINEAIPMAKKAEKADEDNDYDKIEKLKKKNKQLEEKYCELPGVVRIFRDVDEHEMGDARYERLKKIRAKVKKEGFDPDF